MLSDGSIGKPNENDLCWVKTVKYYYDDYGNVIQEEDALGNSIYTTYDTKYGLFPVRIVNDLGYTNWNYYDYYGSEYDVDAVSNQIDRGRLTKTTFENTGFYSSQYYDAFGRVVKKVRMDYSESESTEEIKYTDATIDETDGSITTPASVEVHKRPSPGPEGPDNQIISTYTYTDGRGRTIQTKTKNHEAGGYTTVDNYYQIIGEKTVAKTTAPYLTSDAGYSGRNSGQPMTVTESWHNGIYGWKTVVTGTDGSVTTTEKRVWHTTVTDPPNNFKETQSNGFGRTMEIKESNGAKPKAFEKPWSIYSGIEW